MSDKKPWQGRFTEATDSFVEAFTASVTFDQLLARQDIEGSIAHATMLSHCGILNSNECQQIIAGLEAIAIEIENDNFEWSVSLEDVHMNIERALTDRIGDVGKKLHTGRSRNDQVATDVRLWVRQAIDHLCERVTRLQSGLLDLAEREANTILPGFTHLQVAQPVTFGHHLLAWYEMVERDHERLQDCRRRVNRSPLGAAALAGTSFPIDREETARLLDFDSLCVNSIDAVSDRDFAIEFVHCCSLLMIHLSRWAEEMIIWSSWQFQFISLPDRFCTGSSIMPQKKNPDVPELVRGKSSRVLGHLVALLTLMKSQPLAYNKDNQEDKEPLFDTVETVNNCLTAFADMIPAMQVNHDKMLEAARSGFATATDLADYLVKQGIAFRDAHEIVGQLVGIAIDEKVDLADLPLSTLQAAASEIEPDVYEVLTLAGSVKARNHIGGTSPNQVRRQIAAAREHITLRGEAKR